MTDFSREFESRIHALKADFVAITQWQAFCAQDGSPACHARLRTLQDGYRRQLRELRQAVRANFSQFDARRVSTLMALPSQRLDGAELTLHRIWLGGALPALAAEAVRQWQCAIDASGADGYSAALWVWDARQLRQDASFLAAPGARHRIGTCVAAGVRLEVFSLRQLAQTLAPSLCALLEALHQAQRYVNLADFFRLLVLYENGGIYLDVDTMPYRAAPVFLAHPEVPDYVTFAPEPRHICWMNLVDDENGMLVARRGTPALAQMVSLMSERLAALPAHGAGDLHDATYSVWRAHLGRSFAGYHQLAAAHAVLFDEAHESVISGVRGMRLLVDALSGAARPLDDAERQSYARCVANLARHDWRLSDPLALAQLADIATSVETPRMAYAAQLRAEQAGCHYYSFLSQDAALDRVNALFGAYLLAHNAARIAGGDFWCRTRGRTPPSYAGFELHQAPAEGARAC